LTGAGKLASWQAGLNEYDELIGIGIDWRWRWQAGDGTMTKAPLGGEETGPNPTDRAKDGTKRSVLVDAHGVPLAVTTPRDSQWGQYARFGFA
jgi:hypothetical protein